MTFLKRINAITYCSARKSNINILILKLISHYCLKSHSLSYLGHLSDLGDLQLWIRPSPFQELLDQSLLNFVHVCSTFRGSMHIIVNFIIDYIHVYIYVQDFMTPLPQGT